MSWERLHRLQLNSVAVAAGKTFSEMDRWSNRLNFTAADNIKYLAAALNETNPLLDDARWAEAGT